MTQSLTTLERVAAGDPSAVRVFVERYSGLLWSLARRYCPNRAEAEDAVQDVFTELWEKAGRFDPARASEQTFVTMVARRRMIDRLRRLGRNLPTVPICETGEPAREPIDQVERDDTLRLAQAALKTLPEDQQKVIRYSVYHGLSHPQIAERLGIPLGTVKTHARRGLMKLRDAIRSIEPVGSGVSS